MAQNLLAQQAEHERHQRDIEQFNAQLRALMEKVGGGMWAFTRLTGELCPDRGVTCSKYTVGSWM